MHRIRHVFRLAISTILVSQIVLGPAAWAAPFNYFQTFDGKQSGIKATLPVKQLGQLTLPGGLVVFDGNDIEVQAIPEGLFDPRQVLTGIMIKSQIVSASGPQAIKGLAYFFGGIWLKYLSSPPAFELISKNDGSVLTGQIVEGDEKSLTMRQSNGQISSIEFSQIANIESPRALAFFMPVDRSYSSSDSLVQGQTSSVRFNANNGGQRTLALKRPVDRLLGDEHGISKGSILSYLMLDLFATIAPAIATPLVINNRTSRTASRAAFQANAAPNFVSSTSSSSSGN